MHSLASHSFCVRVTERYYTRKRHCLPAGNQKVPQCTYIVHMATEWLQGWALLLCTYNYGIESNPTHQRANADRRSRLPLGNRQSTSWVTTGSILSLVMCRPRLWPPGNYRLAPTETPCWVRRFCTRGKTGWESNLQSASHTWTKSMRSPKTGYFYGCVNCNINFYL